LTRAGAAAASTSVFKIGQAAIIPTTKSNGPSPKLSAKTKLVLALRNGCRLNPLPDAGKWPGVTNAAADMAGHRPAALTKWVVEGAA